MVINDRKARICARETLEETILEYAFSGLVLPVDDGFLWTAGYARILAAADFTFDPALEKLTAIPLVLDELTKTAADLAVMPLTGAELLAAAKTAKIAAVAASYAAKIAAGMTYTGKTAQIDESSRNVIAAGVILAQVAIGAGGGWSAQFKWRMADNTWMALPTPQTMVVFGVAVANYYAALFFNETGLKDACAAAADLAALAAIDITAGWPPN